MISNRVVAIGFDKFYGILYFLSVREFVSFDEV